MGDEEVRRIAQKLREARTLTDHKNASNLLKSMLDQAKFCRALDERVAEGSDGWSSMLKSVVIGLSADPRRGERAEHVAPLKELIERASKSGARLECRVVERLVTSTLDEEVLTQRPPQVAALYWSVLSTLCSCADYFRLMGRSDAAALGGRLVECCWSALLSSPSDGGDDDQDDPMDDGATAASGSGGTPGTTATGVDPRQAVSGAVRLLCGVLSHFPFALPEAALRTTIENFVRLPEVASDELRPRLPEVWMSMNAMLRQQVPPRLAQA